MTNVFRAKCIVVASVSGFLGFGQSLRAGPEVCESDGGPAVCVRFDNLPVTPQEDVDYNFDFSTPSSPSVVLERGEDTGGTMYEWRIWSKDSQDAPANIGSITAPGGHNYSVKILNPTDGSGAANVQSIVLDPSGDHNSSIAAAWKRGTGTYLCFSGNKRWQYKNCFAALYCVGEHGH